MNVVVVAALSRMILRKLAFSWDQKSLDKITSKAIPKIALTMPSYWNATTKMPLRWHSKAHLRIEWWLILHFVLVVLHFSIMELWKMSSTQTKQCFVDVEILHWNNHYPSLLRHIRPRELGAIRQSHHALNAVVHMDAIVSPASELTLLGAKCDWTYRKSCEGGSKSSRWKHHALASSCYMVSIWNL